MLDRVGVPTDPALLGAVTSTFYGGRAECHIRNTPVPVSVCDFTSMYPTVDILMRVWDLLTFERVEVVDCTDELRRTAATERTPGAVGARRPACRPRPGRGRRLPV